MKSRLFLFTVLIFVISAVSAISFAQRKPDTDQPIRGDFKITIKTKITKLGIGEKARAQIKLRNGQKIKGYVSNAGEKDFALTDGKSGQTTTIAYTDVVEVKKPGMTKRTKILIGVGIGVVATAAILAWAVTHSLSNFDFHGIAIR